MFEWLENIWNAIKGFFGFFESVLVYIKLAFNLLGQVIKYPFDMLTELAGVMPPIIWSGALLCLLVWIIRTITGRDAD